MHETEPTYTTPAPVTLDTRGLICPEPIMLLHRAIRKLKSGEQVRMLATDPSTERDVPKFCSHLGHTLLQVDHDSSEATQSICFLIEKG